MKRMEQGKWIVDPFYLTTAWKQVRDYVLARDNHLCQHCIKRGRGRLVAGNTVHHIKDKDLYPDLALDPDNLVTWNGGCHAQYHREQEAEQRRGEPSRKRKARIVKG